MGSRVHWRVLNKTDGVGQQPAGFFLFRSELDFNFVEIAHTRQSSSKLGIALA